MLCRTTRFSFPSSLRCRVIDLNPKNWVRTFRHEKVISGEGNQGRAREAHVPKAYHSMTPAERVADRIARNQSREQTSVESVVRWSLPLIVAQLDKHRQRASYGAVAGLVGVLPRGLMNGRPKSTEYSWVVAGSGRQRGWPTGYTEQQIDPECLRQIRRAGNDTIESTDQLRAWLATGSPQSED